MNKGIAYYNGSLRNNKQKRVIPSTQTAIRSGIIFVKEHIEETAESVCNSKKWLKDCVSMELIPWFSEDGIFSGHIIKLVANQGMNKFKFQDMLMGVVKDIKEVHPKDTVMIFKDAIMVDEDKFNETSQNLVVDIPDYVNEQIRMNFAHVSNADKNKGSTGETWF